MTLPLNYKQPEVKQMFIPISETTRPGIKREITKGIVDHHTALIDVPAIDFYYSLKNKANRDNKLIKKYGSRAYTEHGVYKSSFHIALDFDGTIFVYIPLDEIAYAAGSTNYSRIGKEIFESQAWKFSIDTEICVSEPDYHINNRQQEVLADLNADLCIYFSKKPNHDLYKHFDIALDKPYCPAYYIKGLNWERHISMSKRMYDLKMSGKLPILTDLYK